MELGYLLMLQVIPELQKMVKLIFGFLRFQI
jgi:hypothetical protein